MATETAKFFQTEHIDEIFEQGQVIKDGVALPLEIEMSLVDSCTRNCFCCPRGDDTLAPNTELVMQPNLYRVLGDELKMLGYKGLIMLSGFGECLLHPNICDVIRSFNFTYVDMNTNGDLLTRDKIKDIIDAGINKIMISVYEPEGMPKFKEMIKGYEDHCILRNRFENFDRLFNNRGGAVKEAEDLGTGSGIKGEGICYYPYYLAGIDSNGDVYPCCHEWTRRLKMGNLYQNTFWNIWTSKSFEKVRRVIAKGKRELYPCRECNVDGKYRGGQNFEFYSKQKTEDKA